MPSRNPHTGRRESGASQRKGKRHRALAKPLFANLAEPPALAGTEAIEAWASGLNLRVGVAIGDASDEAATRLKAIATIIRELGKLKDKARRAEKALRLRELRLQVSAELRLDDPPYEDPPARIPWVLLALAQEAHQAATQPGWPQRQRMRRVKVLAQTGFVPCNFTLGMISDAVDRLDASEARGG